ncbi:DUF3179 domain-containing protein [Leisingera sp. ANG-S5]|uniref:DUF3179 domain-containing protein n=1 Tax=Leisingera sp. ANG-S5 TaxID=1577901 RepID=UPI00057DBDDF|nr:DUF3179 domain-containing protein [Leisingera sp. ANG-S5]KIC34930.1 hypothetical protein RA25_03135 [Leisingera sp. ANG-S5]
MFKGVLLCLALLLPSGAAADPQVWKREWPQTDFCRTNVPEWRQIRSGGVGKDAIPALDEPQFVEPAKARRLKPREPVITLQMEGAKPRAYPLRYLTWHEIVNDVVAGVPVAVTYCPLCNSAVTFDRRTAAGTLSFGVSGKLRFSDMVMYDRESQSWWQQATGTGIVGRMTGTRLKTLPSWVESWQEFTARNPDGLVMAEPGWNRDYGRNPYRGYDTAKWPFLYDGSPPPHGVAPMARVVRVGSRAWPLDRLAQEGEIREAGLVLSWRAGQASALDTGRLSQGRDIGSVRVRDAQGRDVPHDVMFAFAFHAFWPDGTWMLK